MRRVCLALLVAAGCGSGAAPPDGVDEEPVLPGEMPMEQADAGPTPTERTCEGVEAVLGSGARVFEAVKDGDTVYLFRGPQGGYMIYLSVRAKGLDRSLVYVDYTEHREDTGQLIGFGQWKVQLTNDLGGGWWERVGIWGEIEPEFWTRPSIARGQVVTVKAKLTDQNGCSIDDLGWTVNVHPDPPPN
jgi:hypothetical protein